MNILDNIKYHNISNKENDQSTFKRQKQKFRLKSTTRIIRKLMKHQQVKVDYFEMLTSGVTIVALIACGWVLLK